jgi:glycosyltransferase involved in cell wall biosynthesis
MKKIKVLIGCLSFSQFTGSEMYVYELAKNLVNLNCDVTVVSPNIGGPLTDLAFSNRIKIHNIKIPFLKKDFDIIHTQHTPITEHLIRLFPNTKKISTIHSEVISLENPVIHDSIVKYIAIRPEIKKHIIDNFWIPEEKIEVIYNPIDASRFNTDNTSDMGYTLFVGTIDYLRKKTIEDLVNYTKLNGKELYLVGKNYANYLNDLLKNDHIKYFPDTNKVEDYVKNCSETAGILLGRTTIEGWMCGKPGWIYNIDERGNILNKEMFITPDDIGKFNSIEVAKKIKEEYIKILN